jgi:UDP-N-acetylglucosamine--N-acetylmuramyl-(pentapeptide) pyrophosphoryl-undecaprenol N-acetylglucosamine transferase
MARPEKRIVLTGGGTAGHVTPNLALVPALQHAGWQVRYIGSHSGIERELVNDRGLPYEGIDSGKLRRYASLQNWTDPLRVLRGLAQAYASLGRDRPDVVFSKGGYVTVPVVVAAALRRIPVVVHESDRTPGLANRLTFPFAARICVSFEDSAERLRRSLRARPERVVFTGAPMRPELLRGDSAAAERRHQLDPTRALVLVVGGSLGARAINEAVFALARTMPPDLQIVHVCGKGNLDNALAGTAHYHAFEYLQAEYPDVLARADVVVSRAGANSLAELLALRKPALLIPLPAASSRGDQLENARVHVQQGYGRALDQGELDRDRLERELRLLLAEAPAMRSRMALAAKVDATTAIVGLLEQVAAHTRR